MGINWNDGNKWESITQGDSLNFKTLNGYKINLARKVSVIYNTGCRRGIASRFGTKGDYRPIQEAKPQSETTTTRF